MRKKSIFFLLILILSLSTVIKPAQAAQEDRPRFTILHTNDEHSHLIPHPSIDDHPELPNSARGGLARLAGLISEIKAVSIHYRNREYSPSGQSQNSAPLNSHF